MRFNAEDFVRADERQAVQAQVFAKLDDLRGREEFEGEVGALAISLLEEHLSDLFDREEE